MKVRAFFVSEYDRNKITLNFLDDCFLKEGIILQRHR